MEAKNAFIGRPDQPTLEEVDAVLGKAAPLWHSYLDWLSGEHGVDVLEWKSVSAKYGWGLRLRLKARTIVYLGPSRDCLLVSFVLGNRSVATAKATNLSKAVLKVIEDAPKYAEGTGVRLIVRKAADLVPVKILTQIKLDN